ncbi:prepilin-type N-terminal cleavage/methylation domain-containing protein [Cyanobacterium aponinum 0216]|uniref:Prepilin-type N-terminal cleavage/methylation domain-containing protein n=1 Tax=Cyanobacterium aponinum 0216 TaxID=2676140 RepID=A0A844GVS4_9CHRO|nr:type II secretion system protein [Cyanobacterium aponinum]MTF38978.1 prepilin-type N-terminal cleavage/methylation domain-containing protein [Cyanobacterium aponinum 0216]
MKHGYLSQWKLSWFCLTLRPQRGFTLIELLVVITILGILGAIAIPNFLKQVGKAREVELQNIVGAINRAQQAYHFEKQRFVQGVDDDDSLSILGLSMDNNYIDSFNIIANTNSATTSLVNNEYIQDGTRAYSGSMYFNSGIYEGASCRSIEIMASIPPPTITFSPVNVDCGTNIVLK